MCSLPRLLFILPTVLATFNLQQPCPYSAVSTSACQPSAPTYAQLPPAPPPPPPPPQPSYSLQYPPSPPQLPSYMAPPTFIISQSQQLPSQSIIPMQSINIPSQSFENAPSNYFPSYQDSLVNTPQSSFVNPPQSFMNPSIPQSPQYVQRQGYQKPMYATIVYATTPAPKCWRSKEGFPCCNRELESFIQEAMNDEGLRAKWKGCNLQKAANDLQRLAQSRFNLSFESIIAQSQMENKSRFMGDMMCKLRMRDGRIALLYATPSQYSLDNIDYHPLSDDELQERNWTDQQKEITSTDDI